MEPGTVFRLNEPITDVGYNLTDIIPVYRFPVYGVIRSNNPDGSPSSVVYYWGATVDQWIPLGWNWMHKHLENFEEVQID